MKKVIISTLLGTSLILSSIPFSGEFQKNHHVEAATFKTYAGFVSASKLPLTKTENAKSSQIGLLLSGENVTVIGKGKNGRLKVNVRGLIGFVDSRYVKSGHSFKPYTGLVNASTLNVRSGPSTKYKSISTLKKNAKVTVQSKSVDGFIKVTFGKITGFVSSKYVKKATSTASTYPNQRKLYPSLPNPPKPREGYYDEVTETTVLKVDVSKANLVPMSTTLDYKLKSKELVEIGKAIGAITEESTALGRKPDPSVTRNWILALGKNDSGIGMRLFQTVPFINIQDYDNGRGMEILLNGSFKVDRNAELNYLMLVLLQPYFPETYKKVFQTFINTPEIGKKYTFEGRKVIMNDGIVILK